MRPWVPRECIGLVCGVSRTTGIWGRESVGTANTVLTLDPGGGGRWSTTAPYQSSHARLARSLSAPRVGWAPQGQARLRRHQSLSRPLVLIRGKQLRPLRSC